MAGQQVGLIGVTGASGQLGRRVAERLAKVGVRQRLITRDASKAPQLRGSHVARIVDYADAASMKAAIDGVSTLFLVSASEHPDRVQQHSTAVDAAVAAGVDRIVYTSIIGAAPDAVFTLAHQHFATEEHIKSKGIAHTFLRNSLYLDLIPCIASEGTIRGPGGSGRLAPVSRDDIADCVVAVLTSGGTHDGQTYDLTGPSTLSLQEAAMELSRVAGHEIGYVDETMDQAWESRRPSGKQDWEIEGWISSYTAIAKGEMDLVSEAVPKLTGHPAMSLTDYLAAHPESFAALATSKA